MTQKHILWLIGGLLFWGIFPVFSFGLIAGKEPLRLLELVVYFFLTTIFVTFAAHYYLGGFQTKNPKRWFFAPLFCWVLFSVFQLFEASSFDNWIFLDVLRTLLD